jgi:hypothetical protein
MKAAVIILIALALASTSCAKTTYFTSPTATVDSEIFQRELSGAILPGGSVSRSFDTAAPGTVTVLLKSTTPGGIAVGMGVGITRSNGSCALGSAVEATAGAAAQISISADKGAYCAKVYDLGTLQEPLPFTIAISHP